MARQAKGLWRRAHEAGKRARAAGYRKADYRFWGLVASGDYSDNGGFDLRALTEASRAAQAFFEAGIEGFEEPPYVQGVRLGPVAPGQEESRNYRDDTPERGISVLSVNGRSRTDDRTFELFNDLPAIAVDGFLLPWRGSDGEPLLVDVKTLP